MDPSWKLGLLSTRAPSWLRAPALGSGSPHSGSHWPQLTGPGVPSQQQLLAADGTKSEKDSSVTTASDQDEGTTRTSYRGVVPCSFVLVDVPSYLRCTLRQGLPRGRKH